MALLPSPLEALPHAQSGKQRTVAIVGGGWAGLAAAVAATQAGHNVSLFEANRTLGGRARALAETAGTQAHAPLLDNGQHILIGAYVQALALMREVGVDVDNALLRMPLALIFPDGSGLRLPAWPAPWDVLAGVATARGWTWQDKWSLLRTARNWQKAGYTCDATYSVADLCLGLTARVVAELTDPLCVSALNTPSHQASGQVFLRVLQDALFGARGASQLLLPRVDLGQLLPDAAHVWLKKHGAQVMMGQRVQRIELRATGNSRGGAWQVDGQIYDQVILACPPGEAARLLETAHKQS